MGTRNLVAVVVDGKHKVAQYGQWDGYPEGQGKTVLAFLATMLASNREHEFADKVRGCTFIDADALKALWVECGADPNTDFVSLEIAEKFKDKYPHHSRDTGGKILQLVLDNGPLGLYDNMAFGLDGLFCEFAYVVDLDNRVLEFYKGFNRDPKDNAQRFMALEGAEEHLKEENKDRPEGRKYYAVRLVNTYPFDSIAASGVEATLKEMISAVKDPDEDE